MIPLPVEVEVARTAQDLFVWINRVFDSVATTREGKAALRIPGELLVKKLVEEVWPLSVYAWLFHRPRRDILFKPILAHEPPDACIFDASTGSAIQPIEITAALDGDAGYQEHLRSLHLDQHGRAPLTGAPLSKDRRGRVPETFSRMVDLEAERAKEVEQIRVAIGRKAGKGYPRETLLIVGFQGRFFQDPEDREALLRLVEQLQEASRFCELALVDAAARFGVRFPPAQLRENWRDAP